MRKLTLSILACLPFFMSAQESSLKGSFDDKAAKEFFAKDEAAVAQAREKFREDAVKNYSANQLKPAAVSLLYADYLALLDEHGKTWPAELKEFFLSNTPALEELILILKPEDDNGRAFSILEKIWRHSPEDFAAYTSLAVAIAIVFDTPPPKTWPHHQVSEELLPRTLPDPLDAFKMWADFRKRGRLLLQTEKLSAEEIKFFVASPSTAEDKEWAQKSASTNLQNIPKLYASVEYDHARIERKAYDWGKADYRLKTIKGAMGICTDQAYYTTEVAKARGVPAFILSGAGADGFHAWAAYMPRRGSWNFDVGRYEASRFVTGKTVDPQTWKTATCHALENLRENFRGSAKYQDNVHHTRFAKKFLEDGNFERAETAAEAAIKLDDRNSDSWNVLIAAAEKRDRKPKDIDEIYARAIRSFSKYPDLDAQYRSALMERLLAAGDTEGARRQTTSIITKTRQSRPDIAMDFAKRELLMEIKSGDAKALALSYKSLLNSFKKDGTMAYSYLTIDILNTLLKAGRASECPEIMKITRQVLKPEPSSTLDVNMKNADEVIAKQIQKK